MPARVATSVWKGAQPAPSYRARSQAARRRPALAPWARFPKRKQLRREERDGVGGESCTTVQPEREDRRAHGSAAQQPALAFDLPSRLDLPPRLCRLASEPRLRSYELAA